MFGFHFWLCGECLLFWHDTAFGNTKAAFEIGDALPFQNGVNTVIDDLLLQIEKLPECPITPCRLDIFNFNAVERQAAARTLAWLFFMVPDPTPIVSMLNHLVDRSFPTVDILGGD